MNQTSARPLRLFGEMQAVVIPCNIYYRHAPPEPQTENVVTTARGKRNIVTSGRGSSQEAVSGSELCEWNLTPDVNAVAHDDSTASFF